MVTVWPFTNVFAAVIDTSEFPPTLDAEAAVKGPAGPTVLKGAAML